MEQRTGLENGFELYTIAGWRCRIVKEMSRGGTALTYLGEETREGQEPVLVYLKELYPAGEGFLRQADGRVTARDERGELLLRELGQLFQREQSMGNQMARRRIAGVYPVTKLVRDEATGNLFGVSYQCLPSLSLKELVKEELTGISLGGKVRTMLAICEPVRQLHAQGFYHGDLSPGNILLAGAMQTEDRVADGRRYPGLWSLCERQPQAGLIDFACAGQQPGGQPDILSASLTASQSDILSDSQQASQADPAVGLFLTDGFSAPELYRNDWEDGRDRDRKAADRYSLAACFWYFLTGEPPFDGPDPEILTECLSRHELFPLSGDWKAAHGKNPMEIPPELSAAWMAFFEQGLAAADSRFVSMDLMIRKLSEILAMIEGACVSERQIREGAKAEYLRLRRLPRLGYRIDRELLPVVSSEDGNRTGQMTDFLEEGESVFLIGKGGEGKTTVMLWLMDQLIRQETDRIAVYIELNRIPEHARDGFLERYLAGFLAGAPGSFLEAGELVVGAVRRKLFGRRARGCQYLVMLDGLNEMSFPNDEKKADFIRQINQLLTEAPNVRLVVAGRADEEGFHGSLRRLHMEGVSDAAVRRCLERRLGKTDEGQSILWETLHTPFFLTLYSGLSDRERIAGAGGILHRYFHERMETPDEVGQYGERNITEDKFRGQLFGEGISLQNARRFAMDFLLPELGQAMVSQGRYSLEMKEITGVAELCLAQLAGREAAVRRAARIFGYQVELASLSAGLLAAGAERLLDLLTEQMGILSENGAGLFGFYHQHIRDYFAAVSLVNRLMILPVLTPAEGTRQIRLFFDKEMWPESVLQLAGEVLELPFETPYFDGERWVRGENRNPVMSTALDLLRSPGRLAAELERERKHTFGMAEANLLEMYRLCCRNGAWADFSGLDLSGLDLRGVQLPDVIWSRPDPLGEREGHEDRGLYADLTGAKYKPARLFGKKEPDRILQVVCHPSEPVLLIAKEIRKNEPAGHGHWDSEKEQETEGTKTEEERIGYLLEERNLEDGSVRLFAEAFPSCTGRFGYSQDGSYIWQQEGAAGEVISATGRQTGRKGTMALREGRIIAADSLSAHRLTMAILRKGELFLVTVDLQQLAMGVCQEEVTPVEADLSEIRLPCLFRCQILDETQVLICSEGNIWLQRTGEGRAVSLFSPADWAMRMKKDTSDFACASCTFDRVEARLYLLVSVRRQPPVLMTRKLDGGEWQVIRQLSALYDSRDSSSQLFLTEEGLAIVYGGKLAYMWDTRTEEGHVMKTADPDWRNRIAFACNQKIGVWWQEEYDPDIKERRYTQWLEAFSLADGATLYRQEAPSSMYAEGEALWQAAERGQGAGLVAQAGKEGIRSALDPQTGRLYFYRQNNPWNTWRDNRQDNRWDGRRDQKDAWVCCGFTLVDGDVSGITSIYIDWENQRLYGFNEKGVRAFHLYSGKPEQSPVF